MLNLRKGDINIFQSTHPMRGATYETWAYQITPYDFNPRTPCGVRLTLQGDCTTVQPFQSTHPMRGATDVMPDSPARPEYFNPRTPCGVRPPEEPFDAAAEFISIHAPHAGCDFISLNKISHKCSFQSTHPMRGATPHP